MTCLNRRDLGLLVLRAGTGAVLMAHGAQKLFGCFGGGGLEGTAAAMEHMGFRPGKQSAIAAGLGEMGGGALLAVGLATPAAGAAAAGAMAGAVSVHAPAGFFARAAASSTRRSSVSPRPRSASPARAATPSTTPRTTWSTSPGPSRSPSSAAPWRPRRWSAAGPGHRPRPRWRPSTEPGPTVARAELGLPAGLSRRATGPGRLPPGDPEPYPVRRGAYPARGRDPLSGRSVTLCCAPCSSPRSTEPP